MSNVILDISLWPNSEGTLGVNKVAIPDGVTTFWPEGDALVENFVYKDGKLVGLVDTKALIENESRTTVIPYDFVDITVDRRLESLMTFNAGERCKHLNINYEVYLPEGYKKLDYLQGTGAQFINTEATGNETSEVLCVFERTSAESKAVYTQNTTASTGMLNCFVWGGVMENLRYDWGSKNYGAKNTYPGMVTSVQSANGVTLNGEPILPAFESQTFTSAHLVLFSNRATIGAWTADNVRMARWTLKNGGQPVRDMFAALDPTGAPCMYDLVTETPYYNDSKVGDFAYPNMKQQSTTYGLRRHDFAQITEHGIRRLYHVPQGCDMSKEEYAEQNGFKLLVETPAPEEGYWEPKLTETADAIIIEWVETEAPTLIEV